MTDVGGDSRGTRATGRRPSLRRFLLGRLMLWVMPLLALSVALHMYSETVLLRDIFQFELTERAKLLSSLVAANESEFDEDLLRDYLPELAAPDGDYYYQLWLPSGEVLARSDALVGHPLPMQFGELGEPLMFESKGPAGEDLHCVGIRTPVGPAAESGAPRDQVVVVVAARSQVLGSRLLQGLIEVVWVGGLTAFGVGVAVALALRQGILLIEEVVQTVESVDPANPGRPIPLEDVPAEIQKIVQALNRSNRLTSEVLAQERSFNENVAHELRTPISELRTLTDVSLRHPEQVDALETVRECNEVSRRMGRTVESLLRLSRLQSERLELELQPFDLVGTIRGSILFEPESGRLADERVVLDVPEACPVPAGVTLWALIVNNLVENALEYAPSDSRIDVTLRSEDSELTFLVRNRAPHLDESELQHLTERLWRGRGQTVQSQHSGLGLSIVRAACVRLGAELAFELEGGDLTARVTYRIQADA